jgi:phytoene desaturase
MKTKVGIIGAGLGGLSAAIYLSEYGFDVDVFEKNHSIGGKVSEKVIDGFRFDTGPSLLTMPTVVDDLLATSGYNLLDIPDIKQINPIARNFFSDGTVIDTSSDIEKMMSELARIDEIDALRYKDYLAYSKTIYDNSADLFLFEPIHELSRLIRNHDISNLLNVFRLDVFSNVHRSNTRFFDNEKILKLFDRYATYNGSNPYSAPATLNIIPYVEFVLGGYYIKGGIYKLIRFLDKIIKERNINVYTDSDVEKIILDNKSAKGLKVNGVKQEYDYIVSNADVVYTFDKLIDGFNFHTSRLKTLEPSSSGMIFLWGVKGNYNELTHHNVFFSDDYYKEFSQIFTDMQPPEDPTVYIAITSKEDKEHAPAGHENWFVLVNMPYISKEYDWEKESEKMRAKIFDKLHKFGLKIESNIVTEEIITPSDLERNYNTNKGSIYGISSNTKSTAFRRPANKSRVIENLFFAGGSAHPGGGMPLVILSGKHAATLIYEKHNNL